MDTYCYRMTQEQAERVSQINLCYDPSHEVPKLLSICTEPKGLILSKTDATFAIVHASSLSTAQLDHMQPATNWSENTLKKAKKREEVAKAQEKEVDERSVAPIESSKESESSQPSEHAEEALSSAGTSVAAEYGSSRASSRSPSRAPAVPSILRLKDTTAPPPSKSEVYRRWFNGGTEKQLHVPTARTSKTFNSTTPLGLEPVRSTRPGSYHFQSRAARAQSAQARKQTAPGDGEKVTTATVPAAHPANEKHVSEGEDDGEDDWEMVEKPALEDEYEIIPVQRKR